MLILPWHVGSCHARVTTSESEERTVTGVSETSTSIPTSNFPHQNGHFQNYFEAPLLPRELCHQSTHLVSTAAFARRSATCPKINSVQHMEVATSSLQVFTHVEIFHRRYLGLSTHLYESQKSNSFHHFRAWQRGEKTKATESCTKRKQLELWSVWCKLPPPYHFY